MNAELILKPLKGEYPLLLLCYRKKAYRCFTALLHLENSKIEFFQNFIWICWYPCLQPIFSEPKREKLPEALKLAGRSAFLC